MNWLLDLRERWLLSELSHARNVATIRNAEYETILRLDATSMSVLRARRRLKKAQARVARLERALQS